MQKEKEFDSNDIRVLIIFNIAMMVALAGAVWSNIQDKGVKNDLAATTISNDKSNRAVSVDTSAKGKIPTEDNKQETSGVTAAPPKNTATNVMVDMNDEGFRDKGFQGTKSQTITVIVSNSGQKTHSFVIKELDVDSGPIGPGETKQLTIKLPETSAMYNFTSTTEGDKGDQFTGVVMVLDK